MSWAHTDEERRSGPVDRRLGDTDRRAHPHPDDRMLRRGQVRACGRRFGDVQREALRRTEFDARRRRRAGAGA